MNTKSTKAYGTTASDAELNVMQTNRIIVTLSDVHYRFVIDMKSI